nr:FGGY-family carbohydrate kinase [Actinomyces bouchesdurhonensis]
MRLDSLFAHGGLFKTPGVAQQILADSLNIPVSVGDTAGEGGAWGIAVLARYRAVLAGGRGWPRAAGVPLRARLRGRLGLDSGAHRRGRGRVRALDAYRAALPGRSSPRAPRARARPRPRPRAPARALSRLCITICLPKNVARNSPRPISNIEIGSLEFRANLDT